MRRLIEELVEQRKNKQEKVTQTVDRLAGLLEKRKLKGEESGQIGDTMRLLRTELDQWVTAQDREWDAYAGNHATTVFKSLQWKIDKLEAEYSLLKTLIAGFLQLERSLGALVDSIDTKTDPAAVEKLRAARDRLSVFQYSGFEERFRGRREEVGDRQKKYLSYFNGTGEVLDLGCGRGEFLELLQGRGKTAFGIDVSESMLSQAREKGLRCSQGDALSSLRQMKDASLGGIFSAQTIEHFPPDYLRSVVMESFRVLVKDAWLVMETVNPLSLFALSRIYFLDPSHEKPLHPEYMRYLLESSGFTDVEILFSEELQEEKLEEISPSQPLAASFNRNVDKINRILFQPPEYAVTGRKP